MRDSKELKKIKKNMFLKEEEVKELKKEIHNLHQLKKNENNNEQIKLIEKVILMKSKDILKTKKEIDSLSMNVDQIIGYSNLERNKFKNEQKNKDKQLKKKK